jgi:GH24 family phage-related lysozyme (muramidase)
VNAQIPVNMRSRMDQNMYDALVFFTFNTGRRDRVFNHINAGDLDGATAIMRTLNTSNGIVLRGLTLRREWEINLFYQMPF